MHGNKRGLKAGEGILSAIGQTPLVELPHIFSDSHMRLFAKLEGLNPGGSTKDRPALSIIKRALETGLINPNTVVIESSSGNMGIGLAQVCAYYKLRFICVVDAKTTAQNLRLIKLYGGQIDYVAEPDRETGEYLQARLLRLKALLGTHEDSFWPNQYANEYNSMAHYQTMQEIVTQLGRPPDYLFCATSTCGTLRGCAEYLRSNGIRTRVIAVDAQGSVIFGDKSAKRLIPGHGASITPELYRADLADECIHVSDLDCVLGCRRLLQREAILAGGSSGGVIMAVDDARVNIPAGSHCVAILADRGERYLDTIYSDSWVADNFGDIAHLWEMSGEVSSTRADKPATHSNQSSI